MGLAKRWFFYEPSRAHGPQGSAPVTAIDVLVGVARIRHGDMAVLRALARRERDQVQALRVL